MGVVADLGRMEVMDDGADLDVEAPLVGGERFGERFAGEENGWC